MNLATIRTDLAARLAAIAGLQTYADEPGNPIVPCAIVTVDHLDTHATLEGGADVHLKVVVLVQLDDWATAQQNLDSYAGTGTATSVVDAAEKPTVGTEDMTCELVENYGKVTVDGGNTTYGSATFNVVVLA